MPRNFVGPADPIALVDLLWSPELALGRTGLQLRDLVRTAVEMADADGWSALTMRALAERIGVAPMTLYGYVPGKAELLELMLDRVIGATYAGHTPPAEAGGWVEALRLIARRTRDHALDHPWILEASSARPVLGPGVSAVYEAELSALDGIGLGDAEMDHLLTGVHALADAAARSQHQLDQARSGMSDEAWWAAVGPRLGRYLSAEDAPVSARVGTSVASAGEPAAALELGVDLFIAALRPRLDHPGSRSPSVPGDDGEIGSS